MQALIKRFSLRSVTIAAFIAAGLSSPVALAQATTTTASETCEATEDGLEPCAFIESLLTELKDLAQARDAGEAVDLQSVFDRELDVRIMQRQLLSGRTRGQATREEYGVYRELFPTYIATVYAESIDELVSRTILVEDYRERSAGDFIVGSRLFDDEGRSRARIGWRVINRDGELRLIDVVVEGQSVNGDRKAQFTAIVNRGGFPELISHMREQLGQEAPS